MAKRKPKIAMQAERRYILPTSFDLYNYRQRVFAAYQERNRAILAGEDSEQVWQHFREDRNDLFAHHPQSALDAVQKKTFTALPYFPYNPACRFIVDIADIVPATQTIPMNATEQMTMTTVGQVHFLVEQQPVSLVIYWLDIYGGGLFLPFHDITGPTESYGGGRYLFDTIKGSTFLPVPASDTSKRILLDFNYAYNPSCAYNDAWVCPLAPAANRLPVAIRAGERKWR